MTLTSGAVRSMVLATPFSSPFTVKLTNLRPLSNTTNDSEFSYIQATVCDNEYKMEAYCINKRLKNRNYFQTNANLSYIVSVKGYVTSTANKTDAFVCLTTLDILKVEPQTKKDQTSHKTVKPRPKIQGGTAGTFLLDRAPLFDASTLAGSRAFVGTTTTNNEEPLQQMSNFIKHHAAMKTLHHSFTRTVQSTTENYVSTLREFEATQLNRQKASLTTNSEKSPSIQQANVVFAQYKMALEAACAHASCPCEQFTSSILQQWHGILCGNGLLEHAGQFRKTRVQAGGTSFAPPDQVEEEVNKFCKAIGALESRFISNHNDSTSMTAAATLAAAILFGILDCHAFTDGNGRLARIAIHWAFQRLSGLPFSFNLFATPAQRRDYVHAIQETRRNLSCVTRGDVPEEVLVDVMARTGLLLPLVTLIVHQCCLAVQECNKLVAEKSALAVDEHEAQAARTFRERAAAGTCLICLDENPNVATLCCGKAVHLNCIAQWLSSRSSCPTCRAELPSLPPRVAAPAPTAQEAQNDDTTTVSEVEDTTTDDTEETTEEAEDQQDDTTTYDDDDDTTESVDDTSAVEDNNNDDDTTTGDDDTSEQYDDTTTYEPPRTRVCCFHDCRNKPATDCENDACGRCCVLYGSMSCERHNV